MELFCDPVLVDVHESMPLLKLIKLYEEWFYYMQLKINQDCRGTADGIQTVTQEYGCSTSLWQDDLEGDGEGALSNFGNGFNSR